LKTKVNQQTVRANSADYQHILTSALPLIDLRAPVEYHRGSFPNATNLPLLTDAERALVGTCYKQSGQAEAIALGHELVCGQVKASRLAQWQSFIEQNPEGYLFCFRGGLRSQTVQRWLQEAGINYPLIQGGYKEMRSFLMQQTLEISKRIPLYLLSGFTGVGKTICLTPLTNNIDLEGLANHRGSSFGRTLTPQPTQINFENNLAIKLLKLAQRDAQYIVLEDESQLIGSRCVPLEMHQVMQNSPLIILEATLEQRTENIYQEYIIQRLTMSDQHGITEPIETLHRYLSDALIGIRRRLGDEGFRDIQQLINEAVQSQLNGSGHDKHRVWISRLLELYYDPMYRYQLAKKQQRVIFSGNVSAVTEYINSLGKHAYGAELPFCDN
jgi:tRNA 2-selenouridine synthase